jgi:hypothetical protein
MSEKARHKQRNRSRTCNGCVATADFDCVGSIGYNKVSVDEVEHHGVMDNRRRGKLGCHRGSNAELEEAKSFQTDTAHKE